MDILAAMDTSKQDTSSGIFVIDRLIFWVVKRENQSLGHSNVSAVQLKHHMLKHLDGTLSRYCIRNHRQ